MQRAAERAFANRKKYDAIFSSCQVESDVFAVADVAGSLECKDYFRAGDVVWYDDRSGSRIVKAKLVCKITASKEGGHEEKEEHQEDNGGKEDDTAEIVVAAAEQDGQERLEGHEGRERNKSDGTDGHDENDAKREEGAGAGKGKGKGDGGEEGDGDGGAKVRWLIKVEKENLHLTEAYTVEFKTDVVALQERLEPASLRVTQPANDAAPDTSSLEYLIYLMADSEAATSVYPYFFKKSDPAGI